MARLPKQPKPEFNLDSILNNPNDARRLKEFVDYACTVRTKIELANDDLKSQRDDAKDLLGIPPKLFNMLVKGKMNDGVADEKEKVDGADLALYKLWGISGKLESNGSGSDEEINGDE